LHSPSFEDTRAAQRDARIGWAAWGVLIAIVGIALAIVPERSGVTYVYRDALHRWLAGQDLYNADVHGFLYLPASVMLYGPLLLKPALLGEMIWRCLAIGIFAVGTWRFSLVAAPSIGRPIFAILSLVGAILALPAARAGQATLPMAGLILLAVTESAAGRDSRVGLAAVGSLLLKPLSIPVVLLLAACRLKSIPIMLIGTAIVLAAPFLLADAAYGVRQYSGFWQVLTTSDKFSGHPAWATIAGMMAAFGIPLSASVRQIITLLTALITLGGCLVASRCFRPPQAATTIYALAMIWLMLFSPRTENNTYVCIAPTLGIGIATALYGDCIAGIKASRLRVAFYVIAIACIIGAYELGKVLAPGMPRIWLAPLAGAFILLDVWRIWWRELITPPKHPTDVLA